MRPYTTEFDEPEGFEDFIYERTTAHGKHLRARRREAGMRHEHRHRGFGKHRVNHDDWDWDDDDDIDSYLDDSYDEFYDEQ